MISSLNRSSRNRSGFTFLEIMFVVVIIGILLAIVGPKLAGRSEKARITATKAQMQAISTALKSFEVDNGSYPKELADLLESDDENKESYLDGKELPKDSWGKEFNYKAPGDHNKKSFDIWSNGPDKEEGTEDDIANWAVASK
ncbi:MAG TPA: type II secretion system major pseudopilin GspG [Candidatus Sumerlaeota bacterium]|nr:type II secretion system major pseudopilin GspG [Candidatus Sumerlaeota bacterium]HNM45755.1 type II secretion system major pseudopilin GspG [Candidatus Sumerlaeota bacterium]